MAKYCTWSRLVGCAVFIIVFLCIVTHHLVSNMNEGKYIYKYICYSQLWEPVITGIA